MDDENIDLFLQIVFDEQLYPQYREKCKNLGLPNDDYFEQGYRGDQLMALETERFRQYQDAVWELVLKNAKSICFNGGIIE